MAKVDANRLYGMLDVLILRTLSRQPLHGLEVSRQIQSLSQDFLKIEQGALYPALHRLEAQGLLTADWGLSENNRKARFYKLTAKGRRRLKEETKKWVRHTEAVSRVLGVSWGDVS